jgi:tRNA (cytidine/uridine-2'-O-)-methyltransferase
MSSDSLFLPPQRHLESPLCRVALVEPLIPENTGNISRTCVGTNSELHLIHPLGFEITESRVKRAGLDYWKHLAMDAHASFGAWATTLERDFDPGRVFFIETWGETSLHEASFERGDWLVFGKETVGLTREQVQRVTKRPDRVLKIPMPGEVRSLNLSNAVAVTVFELLRQVDAARLKTPISGVPRS